MDVEFGCNLSKFLRRSLNGQRLIFSQFCVYLIGPLYSLGPPLFVSIRHVVRLRSKKEMVRVDARRIIAAMQNREAVGDWATMQFPRNAMSTKNAASKIFTNTSMPRGACGPHPQPTPRIWLGDIFGFEAILDRCGHVIPSACLICECVVE